MKHSAWLSVCAVMAIVIGSAASSGATEPNLEVTDVELGPATMTFDTGLAGDSMGPVNFFEDPGNGKAKGKKKKRDGSTGGDGDGDGGQATECWTWQQSELNFFEKLNNARARHDRPQLRLDPELSRVANYHSYNMSRYQRLYHTPDEKLRERVTNWDILGENVGRGGSVDSLHQAFMDSADHREIVLYRSFNYVGVGVVEDQGVLWVTILFEAYDNPGTTMNMPSTSC